MKIVIMGCGRVGAQLAALLDADGHTIAVLDTALESFRRLPPDFGGTALVGNGIDESACVTAVGALRALGARLCVCFLEPVLSR